MRVLFATTNEGKLREIRQILEGTGITVRSLKDAGIDVDVEENGTTFLENAIIKAKAYRPYTDEVILADDSGLVIDCLGGEPGIYSARYMGRDTSYAEKNLNLIERVGDREGSERSARFTCAIAASFPDGRILTANEHMEGQIAYKPAGCGGFGYDPIFFLPEYGCTSAELTAEQKNSISHRGKALRKMCDLLVNETPGRS